MKPGNLINFNNKEFGLIKNNPYNSVFDAKKIFGLGSIIREEKINIRSLLPVRKNDSVRGQRNIGLKKDFNVSGMDELILKMYFIKSDFFLSDAKHFLEQMLENNYVVDGYEILMMADLKKVWVSQNFANYYFNKDITINGKKKKI